MNNPFRMSVCTPSMGYDNYHKTILRCIEEGYQTAILGVEGVGKTALFKRLLQPEYRKEMIAKNILISSLVEFNETNRPEKVYSLLCNAITNALMALDGMQPILEDLAKIEKPADEQFTAYINAVSSKGYRVVFLIDNFELFTSSAKITKDHHDVMRTVCEQAQYIVVTNYDLNNDSLPEGVWGSFFLMNFANNLIPIGGMCRETAKQFLRTRTEDGPIHFSEQLEDSLYAISGGIPALLYKAAFWAFEQICETGTEEGLNLIGLLMADRSCVHLMEKWSCILTRQQAQLLNDLACCTTPKYAAGIIPEELGKAKTALACRGILLKRTRIDEHGHQIIEKKKYMINSGLYTYFCRDLSRLERCMQTSPLRESSASSIPASPSSNARLEFIRHLNNQAK